MKVWPKPFIYTLSHLLIGFAGYFYPILLLVSVVYQFAQLLFGVRFFLFSLKFEKGNSVEHTFLKLGEIFGGYFLAFLVHYFKLNKALSKA